MRKNRLLYFSRSYTLSNVEQLLENLEDFKKFSGVENNEQIGVEGDFEYYPFGLIFSAERFETDEELKETIQREKRLREEFKEKEEKRKNKAKENEYKRYLKLKKKFEDT